MVKKRFSQTLKLSKYYDHDYLPGFHRLFISWLTTSIVKSSHILARTWCIFLKNRVRPSFNGFQYQFWTSIKISYREGQVLALLCKILALNLGCWNCFQGLGITRNVKQIKFQDTWAELEAKTVSRDNHGQNWFSCQIGRYKKV